jgi:hypothetical protein
MMYDWAEQFDFETARDPMPIGAPSVNGLVLDEVT